MHKLVMASARSLQSSAVGIQKLNQLAALHRVYNTHRLLVWPKAAISLSDSGIE